MYIFPPSYAFCKINFTVILAAADLVLTHAFLVNIQKCFLEHNSHSKVIETDFAAVSTCT